MGDPPRVLCTRKARSDCTCHAVTRIGPPETANSHTTSTVGAARNTYKWVSERLPLRYWRVAQHGRTADGVMVPSNSSKAVAVIDYSAGGSLPHNTNEESQNVEGKAYKYVALWRILSGGVTVYDLASP